MGYRINLQEGYRKDKTAKPDGCLPGSKKIAMDQNKLSFYLPLYLLRLKVKDYNLPSLPQCKNQPYKKIWSKKSPYSVGA